MKLLYLPTRLAASIGIGIFLPEGDALLVILAVNQPHIFFFLGILLHIFWILD